MLLTYIITILFFGVNFNLYTYIFLPISVLLLYYSIFLTRNNPNYYRYIPSILYGLFQGIYGLSPLVSTSNDVSFISLHFKYSEIIAFSIGLTIFCIYHSSYERKNKEKYFNDFNNDIKRIERDMKLRKLKL